MDNKKKKIRAWYYVLDWIYPRRCAFCDGLLGYREKYLCPQCRSRIPEPIREPRCKKCGKPIVSREKEYCYDCSRQEPAFTRGMGLFLYEDPLKTSLMGLKFKGRKEYGIFLGKLMVIYGKNFIEQIHPQVILPVPIHRKKKSVRGYNQAEVLAIEISRGFSIPIRTDLVLRKKSTKAQKELSRKERKKNMEQAFTVKREVAFYQSVLLVDDIYTTGSTTDAIAGKLRKAGVKDVYVLTLCIGKGI